MKIIFVIQSFLILVLLSFILFSFEKDEIIYTVMSPISILKKSKKENNSMIKSIDIVFAQKRFIRKIIVFYDDIASILEGYHFGAFGIKRLKKKFKNTINIFTNEEISNYQNINLFLHNHLNLPRNRILNFSLNELENNINKNNTDSREYIEKLIRNIKYKLILLNAIYVDKEFYDIKFDNQNRATYRERLNSINLGNRKCFLQLLNSDDNISISSEIISPKKWIFIPKELLP